MEKTYKRVPFDVELAKKIQSGEIEGKIVEVTTKKSTYNRHGCIEIYNHTDTFIELPEETPKTQADLCEEAWLEEQKHRPYIKQLLKLKDYTEQLMEVNQGVIDDLDNLIQDLKRICEPPKQKHEFKPFDKVLVKRYIEPKISLRFPGIGHYWLPSFYQYSINDEGTIYYVAGNKVWEQCIPYEGNEHLVGTTDKPKED